MKRSSEDWLKRIHSGEIGATPYPIKIIDPDGWDRENFEESWNEKITFDEFADRLSISTVHWGMPPH
jgi:hypothetical protein